MGSMTEKILRQRREDNEWERIKMRHRPALDFDEVSQDYVALALGQVEYDHERMCERERQLAQVFGLGEDEIAELVG